MHPIARSVSALACGLGAMCAAFAQAGQYRVVHRFQQFAGGLGPDGGLIAVGGTLYGTTTRGGGPLTGRSPFAGALFAFNPATGGTRVLHAFGHSGDGAIPSGSLIYQNGRLFGTTRAGGAYNDGTVYTYDLSTGRETVLHQFNLHQDGAYPDSGLTALHGLLYGTTLQGSPTGLGTVFSFDPGSGAFRTVHAFTGSPDGDTAPAGLTAVGDTLYGITQFGGAYHAGTIFMIDGRTGAERVIYSFGLIALGFEPTTRLARVGGRLYGTAQSGGFTGNRQCHRSGCGTVYAFDLATGGAGLMHQFTAGADGENPQGNLTVAGGLIYGTTLGPYTHCVAIGCGTLFAIDPASRTETVLHEFHGGQDGIEPRSELLTAGGTLFGTTYGVYNCRNVCGTVYTYRP